MDFLDENDYSDIEEDEPDELPEWFLEEEKYFEQLSITNNFKHLIKTEPEFIGITYITDTELVEYAKSSQGKKKINNCLSSDQYNMFHDMYMSLFGTRGNINIYNEIATKIFNRCYI